MGANIGMMRIIRRYVPEKMRGMGPSKDAVSSRVQSRIRTRIPYLSPVCSGPHSNVAVSNFQGSNCGKCAGFDRRRVQALLYDQL